jgi:ABC-type lipoprotein release transport system permease subunit
MPFAEALKLALSSILSHKLRSFLTLLGVIFGVATVIVVVSLVEGFNSYVDEKNRQYRNERLRRSEVFD